MVRSLIKYQRIEMTLRRAKEARRLAEHLISLSKIDTVDSRRRAYSILTDRDLVKKLFSQTAPLFKERSSGFTRVIRLGFRRGDGAELAILELTEKKMIEKLPKKKKEKPRTEARAPKISGEAVDEAKKPERPKTEEPKIKTISKAKPTLEEKKREERAKTEGKKIADKKGFMKNLRGFFRRKTDM